MSWVAAMPVAAALADATGAGLTLGTVLPQRVSVGDGDWSWDADRRVEHVALQQLRDIADRHGNAQWRLQVVWGAGPSAVLEIAAEDDLVVMARPRKRFLDFWRPSAATEMLKSARCSMMFVAQ